MTLALRRFAAFSTRLAAAAGRGRDVAARIGARTPPSTSQDSRMLRSLLFSLLAVSSSAGAIVIRHDLDDSTYRVPASEFPALVDMPGEGHGVLIAPRWVVTAAHVVAGHPHIQAVVIGGITRHVERLVVHPGYKEPPHDLIHQALATGDATLVAVWLASSDDIALLELTQPVADVAPAPLYEQVHEAGQVTKIIGKGATGTGAAGYDTQDPHRTDLRRAFNRITSADGRWLCYVFDESPSALPLEGTTGNGDSGGPALIQIEDQWRLAGLASWKVVQGNAATARPGLYGQTSCNVRISHYSAWLRSIMSPVR
jgi:hypothetical protein